MTDSGDKYLEKLEVVAAKDVQGLLKAQKSYGDSWKKRGGVGAFMMLARKWDRLEKRMQEKPKYDNGAFGNPYDIFGHITADQRSEGVIDDIRDLRRYLILVEAEMLARGFEAEHRDNNAAE